MTFYSRQTEHHSYKNKNKNKKPSPCYCYMSLICYFSWLSRTTQHFIVNVLFFVRWITRTEIFVNFYCNVFVLTDGGETDSQLPTKSDFIWERTYESKLMCGYHKKSLFPSFFFFLLGRPQVPSNKLRPGDQLTIAHPSQTKGLIKGSLSRNSPCFLNSNLSKLDTQEYRN